MQLQKALYPVSQVIVGGIVSLGAIAALPMVAEAASFSRLYVFGDSLSDTGNSFTVTAIANQADPRVPIIPPPSLGYENGRFTNGDNWIDILAPKLGLANPPISLLTTNSPTGVNFAINSATTGTGNTFPIPLPGFIGVTDQVSQFLASNSSADPNALYIVWAGANDYLGGRQTNPAIPVTNISNAVQTLYTVGARNFLVANLPALGSTPLVTRRGQSDPLNLLTAGHNLLLGQALTNLQLLPGINLKPLDVSGLFNATLVNPSQFGLSNTTEPCLTNSILFPPVTAPQTICSNPDEYLFWDDLHPTERVHQFIGELAFNTLEPNQSVPETSPAFALLSLGAVLGLNAARKQKKKLSQERDRVQV